MASTYEQVAEKLSNGVDKMMQSVNPENYGADAFFKEMTKLAGQTIASTLAKPLGSEAAIILGKIGSEAFGIIYDGYHQIGQVIAANTDIYGWTHPASESTPSTTFLGFDSSGKIISVANYDTNGKLNANVTCTYDPNGNKTEDAWNNAATGIQGHDTYDAATGTTTATNYDTTSGQLISTSTLNTTTNSGTTQTYTNGVLTSKTDFGPSSATTTTYDPVTQAVTRVDTVNSDNSGSSVKYDPVTGNTIYSSTTDSTGAVTISTADPSNGSVTTQYPDGKVSTLVDNGYGYTVSTLNKDGSTEIIAYAPDNSQISDAISNADGSDAISSYQNGAVTYAAIINPDGSGSTTRYWEGGGSTTSYTADGASTVTNFHSDGSLSTVVDTQADGTQSITNYGPNNTISSTAVSYADGSGLVKLFYANGNPLQQLFTNADGTGSDTKYNADGTANTTVNNADGSSSTSGFNADGSGYATVTNADGSGNATTYYADGSLATEKITNPDGSNVTKSYYDNANNSLAFVVTTDAVLFGREMRCEVAANDAVFERRVG